MFMVATRDMFRSEEMQLMQVRRTLLPLSYSNVILEVATQTDRLSAADDAS